MKYFFITIVLVTLNKEATIAQKVTKDSVILLNGMIEYYFKESLSKITLPVNASISFFSLKVKLTDSLKISEIEESITTPDIFSGKLNSACTAAFDTAKKRGLIPAKYSAQNLIIPVYILNNPQNKSNVTEKLLVNSIEEALSFKSNFINGIPAWSYPIEGVIFPTVIFTNPVRSEHSSRKFEKFFKKTP